VSFGSVLATDEPLLLYAENASCGFDDVIVV